MSPEGLALVSPSPEKTRDLGREIGLRVGPGAIIALYGDLGSGKTVLVQGLARGLGVPEEACVTSPTYTLINEYPGRCPLYHIDLYRLEGRVELTDIGLEEALYGSGVAAVEWAERCREDAFTEYLAVHLEAAFGDRRKIRLIPHGPGMINLVNDLENVLKEK